MAKLVIYEELEGEEAIFEDFDLSSHRILIGSSEDCNLILDLPDIDPSHASLEFRNDHWVIQDLGGPGGTVLNGVTVEGPLRLHNNDLIELHSVKIRFLEETYVFRVDDEDTAILGETIAAATPPKTVSGRIWFGTIAGITLVVIFVIILLLAAAHFLGLLNIADLVPFLSN